MMIELHGYEILIEKFLSHQISADQFEREYTTTFLNGTEPFRDDVFLLLDWLFAEVDAYTDLPLLPGDDPSDHLNEIQLRKSATEALQKLRALK